MPGRDGCRVPLPWSGEAPPFGFMAETAAGHGPWLSQPEEWRKLTVEAQSEAQSEDLGSMLTLYRRALAIRAERLGDGSQSWLDSGPEVLAFARESGLICVVNLGTEPIRLPPHTSVLLASGPLEGDRLPSDTAVWLD